MGSKVETDDAGTDAAESETTPSKQQRSTAAWQRGGAWRRWSPAAALPRSPPRATGRPSFRYPLLYVAPTGTISVMLRNDVIVEVAVDKALRVLCSGKFAAASNGRGSASCIMHPQARIFQENTKVYSQFGSEKLAVFGSQGVLFTMKRLSQAFLVSSSTIRGTSAVPLEHVQFPAMASDFTLTLFYLQSQGGEAVLPLCEEIVRAASYEVGDDEQISVDIHGVLIRQGADGDVSVNSKPRHMHVSPRANTVHVRTHFVDMAVQEDDKSFVKRGVKRIHVSRSGMVVSDGNCITSMDHYGRIVSST